MIEEFMPHGHCFLWEPDIFWMLLVSHIGISLSYLSIPFALTWFIRKRLDVPFRPYFWLFIAFIMLCGIGHSMSVVDMFFGLYRLSALVHALTLIASLITAIAIWPAAKIALRIPSIDMMEKEFDRNRRLQGIIEAQNKKLEQLKR